MECTHAAPWFPGSIPNDMESSAIVDKDDPFTFLDRDRWRHESS
jgi:hypothetical protein